MSNGKKPQQTVNPAPPAQPAHRRWWVVPNPGTYAELQALLDRAQSVTLRLHSIANGIVVLERAGIGPEDDAVQRKLVGNG